MESRDTRGRYRRRHAVPAGRRPVRSTRGFPRWAHDIKIIYTARRPARVYRPPSCRGTPSRAVCCDLKRSIARKSDGVRIGKGSIKNKTQKT